MTKPKKSRCRIYADTETYNSLLNGEYIITPYLIGWFVEIYYPDSETDILSSEYYYTNEKEINKFFNCLEHLGSRYKTSLYFYNTQYDLTALLDLIVINKPDWKIECRLDKKRCFSKGSLSAKLKNGETMNVILKDLWVWHKIWKLTDWFVHLRGEHKNKITHGKWYCDFDVNKNSCSWFTDVHKIQQQTVDGTEELDYLKNDVMILPEIREDIEKFKADAIKVDSNIPADALKRCYSTTCPSFSKFFFEQTASKSFDDLYRPIRDKDEYESEIFSYFGGWSFGNVKRMRVMGGYKIVSWDVNSMYPGIMAKGVPKGDLILKKENLNDDSIEGVHYITWYVISTLNPKFNSEFAHLSSLPIARKNCNGAKYYVTKGFYEALCEVLEKDPIIHIICWQRLDANIQVSTLKMYKKRKDPETSKLIANVIKVLMNSVYGKFGEKIYLWEFNYKKLPTHEEWKITHDKEVARRAKEDAERVKLGKSKLKRRTIPKFKEQIQPHHTHGFIEEMTETVEYRSILAAIYITNGGREMLLRQVIEQTRRGNIVLYGDTDSIKFIEKHDSGMVDSKELGEWGYEGEYVYFSRGNRLKRYLTIKPDGKTDLACGGFSKQLIDSLSTADKKIFFHPKTNVIVTKARLVALENSLGQKILCPVDVETANEREPTHRLTFEEDGYTMAKIKEYEED